MTCSIKLSFDLIRTVLQSALNSRVNVKAIKYLND